MTDSRAVLSIDLEAFTHTPAYRRATGQTDDLGIGLDAVAVLLDVLDRHDADATFFVVSELVTSFPGIIADITDAGYEIGSHTHSHRLLTKLEANERRRELEESRELLEEVSETPVKGFRAPAFDLPSGHFGSLQRAGYGYDSSVAPCRRIPGWYGGEHDEYRPTFSRRFDPDAPADLVELPVGVMPGLRLPLTGAWLRFFGVRYTLLGMRLLARRGIAPVLYVHPWELVDLPRIEGVPSRLYWRTGDWMRQAIKRVLSGPFDFVAARDIIEDVYRRASS